MAMLRPFSNDSGEVNPPTAEDIANKGNYWKKIKDAEGNIVSDKGANGAMLEWKKYKVAEAERQRVKEEKLKRRAEKLAKGEPLGPEDELDPEPSALLALAKFLLFLVGAVLFAGWFVTGSPLWEYDGKWAYLSTYTEPFKPSGKLLLPLELSQHDGSQAGKPVYIAIDGEVFDVSASHHNYGPGGAYHNFAGVDASRAFATRCLDGHRTHDLRGLTPQEIESKNTWKEYFRNSKKYPKVGRVFLDPVAPRSPLPTPCGEKPPQFGPQAEKGKQPPVKVKEDL